MATLGASGSSNTSPRWGRTGEPGSAFSGLSRGRGRGRGGAGGGSRGGRGRARGGPKDSVKAEDDVRSTKPDNSQSSESPSTKSSISPFVSTPAPAKPDVSPALPSKPKTASRRGSRAIPVTAVPQINKTVETVSAHMPAKLPHKRRRSQAGKPALHGPPKANLPTLSDNPIQSSKLRLSSESHSETLKDIPPHLNSRFDVRTDIDALVERVRAVAMDNRPSTPKSHIDWAVDDDDTLPDLDDWGVTTTTSTTTQLEVISPIFVDGLRSLPEFATHSTVPSPLKQVEVGMVQPTIDAQSRSVNDTATDKVVPPSPPSTKGEYMKSKFSPEPMEKHGPRTATPLNSKIQPNASISLHPSLPIKPLSADFIVQHTSKPQPTSSPLKSPITPMMDLSGKPQKVPATNSKQIDAQKSIEVPTELTDHKAATRTPEPRLKSPEDLIIVEPTVTQSVTLNVSSDRGGPDHTHTAQESSPSGNASHFGLGASMHAPKGIVDSLSAPANLSTYADSRARDPIHTHTRAHTVGRSPLPDSTMQGQGDYMSRFTRSGHTTPKGGYQGNSHFRTHSTPPGGANHHRSPQTSRPVITGDAISRLARTIGKTHNNLSPPKSHSALTFGN